MKIKVRTIQQEGCLTDTTSLSMKNEMRHKKETFRDREIKEDRETVITN